MKTIKINNEDYKISKKEINDAILCDQRYPAGYFNSEVSLKVTLVRHILNADPGRVFGFSKKEKVEFVYINIESHIWGFEQDFKSWL